MQNGIVPVRKALFGALIDRIVVLERDDIRLTSGVYDPSATAMLGALGTDEAAGQDLETAEDGLRFASRPLRWS